MILLKNLVSAPVNVPMKISETAVGMIACRKSKNLRSLLTGIKRSNNSTASGITTSFRAMPVTTGTLFNGICALYLHRYAPKASMARGNVA